VKEKLGQEEATILGRIVVAVVGVGLGFVDVAVAGVDGVEKDHVTKQCYSSLTRQLGPRAV